MTPARASVSRAAARGSRLFVAAGLAVGLAAAVACGGGTVVPVTPPPPEAPPPSRSAAAERFDASRDAFYDRYLELSPTFAVTLGYHKYDGALPDVSARGLTAQAAWLKEQQAAFEAVPAADLEPDQAIELAVILTQIRGDLFDLEVARWPKFFVAAGLAVGLAAAVACGGSTAAPVVPPPPEAPPPSRSAVAERFDASRDAFYDRYLELSPTVAVTLGYHKYDGALPDVSARGLTAQAAWLKEQQAAFEAVPAADLEPDQAIELAVILTQIRGDRFDLEVARWPKTNPMSYVDRLALTDYITRDYAPLGERARAVIALSGAVKAYLEAAQANLPEAMPRTWVETALLQINGMIDFARKDVAVAFTALDDPMMRTEGAATRWCAPRWPTRCAPTPRR